MIFKRQRMWRYFLPLAAGLLFSACYEHLFLPDEQAIKYNYYLSFNDIQVALDTSMQFMLCSVDSQHLREWRVKVFSDPIRITGIDGRSLSDKNEYVFNEIDFNRIYPVMLKLPDGQTAEFDLQFTPFPVFQIFVEDTIPDEPKIPSWVIVSRANDDEKMISGYMGIEERGRFASYQPKKSFGIEFWDDEYETGHHDVSFFGLLPDDDWILDAMYVDRGRMRNALTFDLWADIQQGRYPELNVNKTGVDGGYVEVFLDTRFQGLYYLGERVDRKRLGLVTSGEQIEGVLYKSEIWHKTTEYRGLVERTSELTWGGWELKYPRDRGEAAWDPLYEYLDFAINATDEEFRSGVFSRIEMSSVIDYYILLNVTKAFDNYGKNIIMTRYNQTSPFLMIPWDLDATWGRKWDGYPIAADGILSNRFYERLFILDPDNFIETLRQRWEEIRYTLLDEEEIFSRIGKFKLLLIASGAVEREMRVWAFPPLNLYWEEYEIQQWYITRLKHLDNYFKTLS